MITNWFNIFITKSIVLEIEVLKLRVKRIEKARISSKNVSASIKIKINVLYSIVAQCIKFPETPYV